LTLLVMAGFLGTSLLTFGDRMFESFPKHSRRSV
jgi:type III secretory pathway component EscS